MSHKAIFIPGNGGGSITSNWFPYVKEQIEKQGVTVIAQDFPDPLLARKEYWLPFIEKLGADEKTILIGHSSGAVAAMRYAETHQILGSVLVGACYTDLGDENEKKSGYYNTKWEWEKIKRNQHWILQFASTDDPYIPIAEARYVHEKLNTEYYEFTDQGHFGGEIDKFVFPELVTVVVKKLQ